MKKIEGNTLVSRVAACPYCDAAKKLLSERNINFIELRVGETIERDDLVAQLPKNLDKITVPQIWIDDKYIGGYTNLVEYFKSIDEGWNFADKSIENI